MARSLEQLQKQYNRKAAEKRGGPMGGGPRGRGPAGRAHGKPKNTKAAVSRLWQYVSAYKLRLLLVLLCMLTSTVASLLGGYLLAPVINRLTLAILPSDAANLQLSPAERLADGVIERFTAPFRAMFSGETYGDVLTYIFTA